MLQGLLEREWLEPVEGGFTVTLHGAEGLTALGLDGPAWQRRAARGGRDVAYGCLDWSERRDHLAGKLASDLLKHFMVAG